jgi:flavodoxin
MKKVLVSCYSRTGHTRRIAEAIAAACGAELEEIRDVKSRAGFFGYWRSGREAWREQLTDIQAVEKNPQEYDLVVLGTPVWAGRVSSPVRTYISEQQGHFKQIALFCTEGGSGGERALRQMATLCGHEPLATLVLTERELRSKTHTDKVSEFVQSLETSSFT